MTAELSCRGYSVSTNTRPSSTTVLYVLIGTMQGGATTSPVLMLNWPLWKLHSTTSPSMQPSESEPGPCVQRSSVTKNSPSTLNTASTRSPVSTRSALPGATSVALHRSIRCGIDPSLTLLHRSVINIGTTFHIEERIHSRKPVLSAAATPTYRTTYALDGYDRRGGLRCSGKNRTTC